MGSMPRVGSGWMDCWVWLIGVPAGMLGFYCSRGRNGNLFLGLQGFAVLGIVYWICLFVFHRTSKWRFVVDLVVWEAGAAVGMLIDAHLEEMSGMLYDIVYIQIALMVIAAWVVNLIHSFFRADPEANVNCCTQCGYDLRAMPEADGSRLARCPECGRETGVDKVT